MSPEELGIIFLKSLRFATTVSLTIVDTKELNVATAVDAGEIAAHVTQLQTTIRRRNHADKFMRLIIQEYNRLKWLWTTK